MSIDGYKIRDQALAHFVTFAVVEWVDVFYAVVGVETWVMCLVHQQPERGKAGTL